MNGLPPSCVTKTTSNLSSNVVILNIRDSVCLLPIQLGCPNESRAYLPYPLQFVLFIDVDDFSADL
jgi:hypothetical protein